ncbi:MAG: acyltransferase family protein [Halobacteriovoraceae bacterium]|nr:acyltransferase family protein [Halobacteriovoraceae bacterium]MCB9095440.1 acyltransferase family protein [Halobacteriovoraceae bacterium]
MLKINFLKSAYLREVSQKVDERIVLLEKRYQDVQDPWGLNINTLKKSLKTLYPLYDKYFRVQNFGLENIPKTPFIVVANHSGQIPIDGVLLIMSFLMKTPEPIVLRGMGERFLFKLPFLGKLATESGTILGDRKNCRYLLSKGESILVFPEGVQGISKDTKDFYKLQDFTFGFYRLAIEQKVPILPVSIVGAEEFYPLVKQNKKLAKLFGFPSFPMTPLFPLAGLLGAIPLPSPVDIHINKPVYIDETLNADAPNHKLEPYVKEIKNIIEKKIHESLPKRRKMFDF